MRRLFQILLFFGLAFGLTRASAAETIPPTAAATFAPEVMPLFQKYCYECHGGGKHKGGVTLDQFHTLTEAQADRETWAAVHENLRAATMPPEARPQPSSAERDLLKRWIELQILRLDPNKPEPGHVTLRRLNRAEYNNTIRDLIGVDFQPAADFPPDDSGYGFDNIGDVLSVSPLLLEKYLAAADKILDQALPSASDKSPSLSPVMQRYFPSGAKTTRKQARNILEEFTYRAWRRPITAAELDRLLDLFDLASQRGEDYPGRIKLAMKAALVSPNFLFRGEPPDQRNPQRRIQPLSDFALATRLSYFLWSSTPDDELLELARRGKLRKELPAQVRRLLADPRAQALVDDFAGQWLEIRRLPTVQPDAELFPEFTPELRAAMEQETRLFCEAVLREDRSVLDFLTADYTFVNARLAQFYGIKGVTGDAFERVSLQQTPRRGVLTQASVLTLTSNPSRTSPVKRGKWVLENLLGTPPPPPPPDVPSLDDKNRKLTGTLREQMVQHRDNPACASCHARMDPIGFGLENFNAIGAWRENDGPNRVDATGTLVSGEPFQNAAELAQILATDKRKEFFHCLAEKMLTYALGRGLEYYDTIATDRIVSQLEKGDARFSILVLAVVNSVPFQQQQVE